MSKELWETVIEKSAQQFRAHPRMWAKGGYGSLSNPVSRREPERLVKALEAGKATACLDTMLQAQCMIVGGLEVFEDLLQEAHAEICGHHNLPSGSIIEFNDGPDCNSAEDAAAFLEAVLEKGRPRIVEERIPEHA